MSEMETHYGKLKKVQLAQGQTLEDWCKAKCEELGCTEIDSYNSSWREQLAGAAPRHKYFFTNENVWEAVEHTKIEYDNGDIYFLQPNEDGTLTFVYRFYNGGTCLEECLEEDLENY